MLRFIYVIVVNIFRIFYYAPKMAYCARHPEKYSDEYKYALALKLINTVQRTGRITTECEGRENLPKEGGYLLFSNHQGRYDALGILSVHERPCSFLLKSNRANQFLAKQFFEMMDGVSIDQNSIKDQMKALRELAVKVKEGKPFLVFPEGVYKKGQGNSLLEFKRGCFLCATKAKCPIVPVTIVDSYKVFGENSLKPIRSKVIFHEPIYYEQYAGMKAEEISDMVKGIIDAELSKYR